MTELSLALEKFVTMRMSLGRISKQDVRILRNFVRFMQQAGLTVVSSDAFLAWRQSSAGASGITWSIRLGLVRRFAEWLVAHGESHSVPPKGLIPRKYQRPRPYIYSQEEIRRLVIACQHIRSQRGVMSLVMPVFIGLIAATGMRISEAIALNIDDVKLEVAAVVVQRGKRLRERVLPLSPSMFKALEAYTSERLRLFGREDAALFVGETGGRLAFARASQKFAEASVAIGIREPQRMRERTGRGPRIHDFRHTFAVQTMLDWYARGESPRENITKLIHYLGHSNPASTYWYIEAVPELLEAALSAPGWRRPEGV